MPNPFNNFFKKLETAPYPVKTPEQTAKNGETNKKENEGPDREATHEEAVTLLKKYIEKRLNAFGTTPVKPEHLGGALRGHMHEIQGFFWDNNLFFPHESEDSDKVIEEVVAAAKAKEAEEKPVETDPIKQVA